MDVLMLEMKEGEKRKSERDDGGVAISATKKKRGKEVAEQPCAAAVAAAEVADEEVEEFFAILRRIHAAVKYFAKGGGDRATGRGRKMIQATGGEINGGLDEKKTEGDENREFDLNALPNEDDI